MNANRAEDPCEVTEEQSVEEAGAESAADVTEETGGRSLEGTEVEDDSVQRAANDPVDEAEETDAEVNVNEEQHTVNALVDAEEVMEDADLQSEPAQAADDSSNGVRRSTRDKKKSPKAEYNMVMEALGNCARSDFRTEERSARVRSNEAHRSTKRTGRNNSSNSENLTQEKRRKTVVSSRAEQNVNQAKRRSVETAKDPVVLGSGTSGDRDTQNKAAHRKGSKRINRNNSVSIDCIASNLARKKARKTKTSSRAERIVEPGRSDEMARVDESMSVDPAVDTAEETNESDSANTRSAVREVNPDQENTARPEVTADVQRDDAAAQEDVKPAIEELNAASDNVVRPEVDASQSSQSSDKRIERSRANKRVGLRQATQRKEPRATCGSLVR